MKKFKNLVEEVLISESPMFVDRELSSNLNDKIENKQLLQKCLDNGKLINKFENWDVYQINESDDMFFSFVQNNVVDAYAEFSKKDDTFKSYKVTQRKDENTKGLLRKAFLNYFSNLFPNVILDHTANNLGKEFFRKLMNQAKQRGLKTTIVNEVTKEEIPYEEDLFDKCWSAVFSDKGQLALPMNILFKIYFK